MTTQGHTHVVHLQRYGIASEQAFVEQFNLGALDKAQFKQTPLQFDDLLSMMTMGADLDDHAAIAASGLAQFQGVGQFHARTGRRPLPGGPHLFDSDYQVRGRFVQQDRMTNCRERRIGYQGRKRRPT